MHEAVVSHANVTRRMVSKRIFFGQITAHPDGTVDTSRVEGVDPDLRVRPFFAQGGTISMREFIVGAFSAEMGLQSP
ncbi:MAG: thiol oxidoreductase-like protein, partial [Nitrospinota bacterium]|nr:thiol oxidoreductase-like protein [Nitrospinota bacterium]